MIDRSIGHQPRPVAKVVRPPPQNAIEAIAYLRPRCDVVPHQQVSHFLPQPGNALLRRTRPQIHMTILPKTMRPERISQKVETLSPCLLDAGLRFVQDTMTASPGDFVYLPRGIDHSFKNTGDVIAKALVLVAPAALRASLLKY